MPKIPNTTPHKMIPISRSRNISSICRNLSFIFALLAVIIRMFYQCADASKSAKDT